MGYLFTAAVTIPKTYAPALSSFQQALRAVRQEGDLGTLVLPVIVTVIMRCPLMLNFHKAGYNLNILLSLLKLIRRLNRHEHSIELHLLTPQVLFRGWLSLNNSFHIIEKRLLELAYPLRNFYNSEHGGKMRPLNRLKEMQLLILLLILLWNN